MDVRRSMRVGLAVSAVALLILVGLIATGGVILPHGCSPRSATRNRECFTLATLRSAAANARDLAALPADAWGTQLMMDQSSVEQKLRSAGSDQRFGTADDLVWPSESAKRFLAESCDSPWIAHE